MSLTTPRVTSPPPLILDTSTLKNHTFNNHTQHTNTRLTWHWWERKKQKWIKLDGSFAVTDASVMVLHAHIHPHGTSPYYPVFIQYMFFLFHNRHTFYLFISEAEVELWRVWKPKQRSPCVYMWVQTSLQIHSLRYETTEWKQKIYI